MKLTREGVAIKVTKENTQELLTILEDFREPIFQDTRDDLRSGRLYKYTPFLVYSGGEWCMAGMPWLDLQSLVMISPQDLRDILSVPAPAKVGDVDKGVILEVKQLRKDIDDVIQRVKDLPHSREGSLSITKLQEGVMWLGMYLKVLGEANPYPSSKDPSTGAKIEPTADGLKL